MVGDKPGGKQSSGEQNKSLVEDTKRLNKQIQYLTENTDATLKEKILIAHELENRNQKLETLGGISQAIIQLQTPERVMELTVNRLPKLLGVDDVGIFLWNNDAEVLTLTRTNKSIDKELAKQVVTRKLGQGLVGMVAKTRQPFYAPDVAELSTVDATPTLVTGVKAFAAVPIATSEKLLGVLTVSSPGQWECTKHRIDVLSIIGNLLAASLENTRLYQDSQNQVKRQRIIYKLSSIINSSLWLNEVYDTFASTHVFGTCKSGVSPKDSVTNDQAQVHGWDNLLICDGSTLPSTGGGEAPSLTIQAMALRAVEEFLRTG